MTSDLSPPRFTCLDVEVDALTGRVIRGGAEQHLRQKAFEVLLFLIAHRDRVVAKEEILDRIWEGVAVTDDTLVQCIGDIRRVLGDDPHAPRFIRTLLKRGYQFIAPVKAIAASTPSVDMPDATQAKVVRRRSALITATFVMAVISVAGVTYSALRAREQTPVRAVPAAPAIDSMTSNTEALHLYSMGLERANAYHTDEGLTLFAKAIALDPEFAMAHARIGFVHAVVNGERATARPHLAKALQLSHRLSEKERMIVEAWQMIAASDYVAAIDRYRLIIDRYPTDLESHLRLGHLLIGEEQIAEAIDVLEHARVIDPSNPSIHNALGAYSYLGRHDDSIAARQLYLELRPHEPNAWDSLGTSYHWAGRYEEALDAYARALELQPDFDLARYHRACTYVQLGRFRDAVEDVQQCINHARGEAQKARAWSTLSDVHRLAGDDARAREARARIPADSSWRPVFVNIDEGRTRGKDWKTSLDHYLTSGGRGSRAERRWEFCFRGYAALRSGEPELAIDLFRRALRFRPPTWYVDSFETVLADALLELGRYDDAAREYERILKINDRYARALYGLGRASEAAGKRAEARDAYRRFITLWKDADSDARDLVDARRRFAQLSRRESSG